MINEYVTKLINFVSTFDYPSISLIHLPIDEHEKLAYSSICSIYWTTAWWERPRWLRDLPDVPYLNSARAQVWAPGKISSMKISVQPGTVPHTILVRSNPGRSLTPDALSGLLSGFSRARSWDLAVNHHCRSKRPRLWTFLMPKKLGTRSSSISWQIQVWRTLSTASHSSHGRTLWHNFDLQVSDVT